MTELGVPYELKLFKHDDVKKPPFTDLDSNGRVPGIRYMALDFASPSTMDRYNGQDLGSWPATLLPFRNT